MKEGLMDEIRRLRQANERLTKALTSEHIQREFDELKAENANLRQENDRREVERLESLARGSNSMEVITMNELLKVVKRENLKLRKVMAACDGGCKEALRELEVST